VILYAGAVGDPVAGWASSRALPITASERELPQEADAVIVGVDRALALKMANRYPDAARVFVAHSEEDRYLPPPIPGAVAATVALSDRQAARAAACVGSGEVVRLRQPVDLKTFSPRRPIGELPRRVLLLGNYHSLPEGRGAVLRRTWAHADLEWREVGVSAGSATLAVAEAIGDVDIVVGYGRSAVEGMACGRAVYIHDHAGTDGWLTADTYPSLEAGGFAISTERSGRNNAAIREDLSAYSPDLGRVAHELARAHHDARLHVAELVALIDRLRDARPSLAPSVDPAAAGALIALTGAHARAEAMAEARHLELKRASEGWASERAALQQAALDAEQRLASIVSARRYRLMSALMRPLDRLRGR
jgi:hypothetical protein